MEFVVITIAVVLIFLVFVVAAVVLSRILFPRVDSAEAAVKPVKRNNKVK